MEFFRAVVLAWRFVSCFVFRNLPRRGVGSDGRLNKSAFAQSVRKWMRVFGKKAVSCPPSSPPLSWTISLYNAGNLMSTFSALKRKSWKEKLDSNAFYMLRARPNIVLKELP
ncbi:unnamed protein product [Discosporangium mesarthrocarpum]